MQFPESWLRELVNPPLSTDELCHLLTMSGLEVEACCPTSVDFSGASPPDDKIITLKLTPNRADCLSLTGIAREVAALTGAPLTLPEIRPVPSVHDETRALVLDAPTHCPRYCGRIVRSVNTGAVTPDWMKQRIAGCGLRPVSALVDITNYVMLELGQPLHAFDDARLEAAIHVRLPQADETLLLLNGQTVTPSPDTALIADEQKALALAGIMGGEHSSINDATTDLFLESAFFTPAAIAGKARALGLSTDASHRYERGVDFELQRRAIERATRLILDICGGHPGPVVEALAAEHLPRRDPVRLRLDRVARILGIALEHAHIERLLVSLGFPCIRQTDELMLTPPPHRYDIAIEEDLVEEVARLYGYEHIPSPPPTARCEMLPLPEASATPMQLRRRVAARGYHEVVNYSFVEADWEADFAANLTPIKLANPIASQMGVMRSSLIGGLVGTLCGNIKRQTERVRIFEVGRCFAVDHDEDTGYRQPWRLAALAAGTALQEQWGETARPVDFYDMKGDLEALFAPRVLRFERGEHPALHPGRSARVLLDGADIGILGEIHPRWRQKYELPGPVVVFEVHLAPLLAPPMPHYREVSRFPAVVRDIALVLPQSCAAQSLLDALREAAPAHVREIRLFDVYQGKGIAPGFKSLAFRITMQDTGKTLADADADAIMQALLAKAQERFGAHLRA